MRAIFRRFFAGLMAVMLAGVMLPGMALAHPMPDSEIIVARGADRLDLTIRVPMDDLLLAMKGDAAAAGLPRDADALLAKGQADDQAALKAYLLKHMALEADGRRWPLVIDAVRLVKDNDPDVGDYAELEIEVYGLIIGDEPAQLIYDLVLGRIANHRAVARGVDGKTIGVIRYNLADKKAEALDLPVVAGPISSAPPNPSVLKATAALEDRVNMINRIIWLAVFTLLALGVAIGVWAWRRRGR